MDLSWLQPHRTAVLSEHRGVGHAGVDRMRAQADAAGSALAYRLPTCGWRVYAVVRVATRREI